MIHATIKIQLDRKDNDEVLKMFHSIVKRTRTNPGCIGCSVYQNIEDESQILFEQLWRNNEEMRHYLQSREYQKILLIVETAVTKPEIRFNTIINTTGIETIEEARLDEQMKNFSPPV